MKTIAVIPARGGSKRLPGKNLLTLGGIPLIAHSIRYAQNNSDIIDEIYVSTDDQAIKDAAISFGAKVIDRPVSISGDNEPTVSALKHVVDSLSDVSTVVVLQPTNPIRAANLLRECLDEFKQQETDSLFTVSRSHHKLGIIADYVFVPYNYEPGQRSQDLEPLFYENGLLYICSAALIRNGSIISEDAFPFVTDDPGSKVDIDTQEDFDYAEYVYQKLNDKK